MAFAGRIAVWALTANGASLARTIAAGFPGAALYVAGHLPGDVPGARRFQRLGPELEGAFRQYQGHVFVMAAGIVVRLIAPLLVHKTRDPAVVVLDEKGRHAVSLLSGHVGGANRLCREIAARIGADPVITTATDVNDVPAIDAIAVEKGLGIENPAAIKGVSMALLHRRPVCLHDPFRLLAGSLPAELTEALGDPDAPAPSFPTARPGILIDDRLFRLPAGVLILRPRSLVVGVGCNRNTPLAEMEGFLTEVLARNHLAAGSIDRLASVDLKADEPALLALAAKWGLAVTFFDRDALKGVPSVPNPSRQVARHIGVESVCEAAAILASRQGNLIVPKQSTRNVTLAVARKSSMW